MLPRSGTQIREDFLRFFEGKQHRRIHSSSLVPANDPTLLFTNAGMNQFKDVFLGSDRRDYARAATSQKCVRAGGKHNDLENVGFTRRHHTFFEMLGNFSFGDYFKRDAIAFAWELLTSPEWFAIDPARLYITIFAGQNLGEPNAVPRDSEAEQLWIEAGVPVNRIFEMSAKDNFWQMGDTGPCGPCSEIFYDLGIMGGQADASGTIEDRPFPFDDQRYVEIWNLVFMQFDRASDGTLTPLPRPSIDTGMGLERIACVLQGHLANFETDLFTPLIKKAGKLVGVQTRSRHGMGAIGYDDPLPPLPSPEEEAEGQKNIDKTLIENVSLRIIADHARAATFLISDGVHPSNEGRGYVLRKILRRAIRHGRQLGQEKPFMSDMVFAVRDVMAVAYPELSDTAEKVAKVVLAEEEQFARVLSFAMKRLDDDLYSGTLSGARAFYLYETFGLPLDFMVDAARDAGITFDMAGFEAAKAEEQTRARASWKGGSQKSASPAFRELPETAFTGYSALRTDGARVLALVKDGIGVPFLAPGEKGEAVLDATSFYADSGGQIGDTGHLIASDHQTILADVHGCTKPVPGVFAHRITARQPLLVGELLDTAVDPAHRAATTRNHTGTHLLHAALREVLGAHVKQAGSLVNPARLRFDFSHFAGVAEEELAQVEDIVNREVLGNTLVQTYVDVPIDEAINDLGATALFGEKYGERVRVVKIGSFSTELCGGIHTAATGEIGLLKLIGESSVASGVRRVEAVSGTVALDEFRRGFELSRLVNAAEGTRPADALRTRLATSDEELKKLRRELDTLRLKSAQASMQDASSAAIEVAGIKLLTQRVDGVAKAQMRDLVDQLRTQLGSGVVILGAAEDGKVTLIVGVTKDLTARIQAGKLVGLLAPLVGGKGGGRPDLAEAGGNTPATLNATLAQAPQLLEQLLA